MSTTRVQTLYPRLMCGDTETADDVPTPEWAAIASAHAMRRSDIKQRFRWLYDYGSEPLTPLRAQAPDASAPLLNANTRAVLAHHFINQRNGNWDGWTRHGSECTPFYKIYLCPCFRDLGKFELRIGTLLADPKVAAFKTVAQRWMALRSDKFIVYFQNADARSGWINEALPKLAGIAGNPVPFTKRIRGSDLLTIATDPQDLPGQSWRSALLRGIAEMVQPNRAYAPKVLQASIRQRGVDPINWEIIDERHD